MRHYHHHHKQRKKNLITIGRKNLYTTTTKKNIMRQNRHYEKEQLNICWDSLSTMTQPFRFPAISLCYHRNCSTSRNFKQRAINSSRKVRVSFFHNLILGRMGQSTLHPTQLPEHEAPPTSCDPWAGGPSHPLTSFWKGSTLQTGKKDGKRAVYIKGGVYVISHKKR